MHLSKFWFICNLCPMASIANIVATCFWFALIFAVFQDELVVIVFGCIFVGWATMLTFKALKKVGSSQSKQ